MGFCLSREQQADDQETDLDPFKAIDRSIFDLLLQHLNGIELLEVSEVSRKWFLVVAKSEVAMKKIELRIVDCEEATKDRLMATALQSPRQYQNLYVCSQSKKALVCRLAGSLSTIRVCSFDMKIGNLKIPNLKKLVFYGDANANGLINSSTSLEELELKSIRFPAADSVLQCLKVNDQLKFLTLGASPSTIFREDLSSSFDFHLNSLSAKLVFISDPTNFFKFLISQAQSLQRLTLHVTSCDNTIFNTAINNLPHLERLEIFSAAEIYGIRNFPPHDLPEGLALIPNPNIKVLRIERLRLQNVALLKCLLDALPNLQSFRVLDSTKNAFLYTIQNANKLTEFRTLLINLIIVQDLEAPESVEESVVEHLI